MEFVDGFEGAKNTNKINKISHLQPLGEAFPVCARQQKNDTYQTRAHALQVYYFSAATRSKLNRHLRVTTAVFTPLASPGQYLSPTRDSKSMRSQDKLPTLLSSCGFGAFPFHDAAGQKPKGNSTPNHLKENRQQNKSYGRLSAQAQGRVLFEIYIQWEQNQTKM